MWLLEINKYFDEDTVYQSVFDYKKDLLKKLKDLGFKFKKFNDVYELDTGNSIYWAWIGKVDKNKIDKDFP